MPKFGSFRYLAILLLDESSSQIKTLSYFTALLLEGLCEKYTLPNDKIWIIPLPSRPAIGRKLLPGMGPTGCHVNATAAIQLVQQVPGDVLGRFPGVVCSLEDGRDLNLVLRVTALIGCRKEGEGLFNGRKERVYLMEGRKERVYLMEGRRGFI